MIKPHDFEELSIHFCTIHNIILKCWLIILVLCHSAGDHTDDVIIQVSSFPLPALKNIGIFKAVLYDWQPISLEIRGEYTKLAQ